MKYRKRITQEAIEAGAESMIAVLSPMAHLRDISVHDARRASKAVLEATAKPQELIMNVNNKPCIGWEVFPDMDTVNKLYEPIESEE